MDLTTRNWLIVLAGTAARVGLNFGVGVLLTRTLGPTDFGAYALLLAITSIVGVAVELGLTETGVKQIAAQADGNTFRQAEGTPLRADQPTTTRLAQDASRRQVQVARQLISFRVGVGLLGTLIIVPFSGLIARHLLQQPAYTLVLFASLLTGLGSILSGTVNALLQATGRFNGVAWGLMGSSLISLVSALGLAGLGWLNVWTAVVVVNGITGVAGFVIGLFFLPAEWSLSHLFRPLARSEWLVQAPTFFRFGLWLWLANVARIVLNHLDIFLVNLWLSPAIVGVYALASGLTKRAEIINHSLHTVLLPQASALSSPTDILRYLRDGTLRSLGMVILLLPAFPVLSWFIPFIYGEAYYAAVLWSQLLLTAVLLDILVLPATLLIYPLNRPDLATFAETARMFAFVLSALWLIPAFGVIGAIGARFGARLIGLLVLGAGLGRIILSEERSHIKPM